LTPASGTPEHARGGVLTGRRGPVTVVGEPPDGFTPNKPPAASGRIWHRPGGSSRERWAEATARGPVRRSG
jgi:hypothetical protein